ncbi:MAG: DsrE family protein, partial [Proteobacteria bacterium]|nr:DsrE family protein [Pseudomonadota bacterium]
AVHSLDMVLCVSAALRRGIVDAAMASEQQLAAANLAPGFRIAGLGPWMEAVVQADRVVRFGTGGL